MPLSPGVYWFLDAKDDVLYVGKAKKLRTRLQSYTRINQVQSRTYKLVSTAVRIKYRELESELEALLVEAQLIKTYQPKYNVDLKDDKSPLYIIVTTEDYPRVLTARKKQLATTYKDIPIHQVFGPFNSGRAARQVIKIGRSIFKFCNAKAIDKKNHKACFYTHINQCMGACKGDVSRSEYKQMISSLKLFLRGKRKSLLRKLEKKMKVAASEQRFEQAAQLRDQISTLEYYYSSRKRLDFDPDIPMLQEDKAAYISNRLVQLLHTAGLVPANYELNRIEAYDISNTSGELSTASMVVFEDGAPAKSEYRQFRIKYVSGPNDTAMLQEALSRRLNHPEWRYPDLIVIDGGKGQLRAALAITKDKIPTVSIVKRPDRLLIPQRQKGKLTYLAVTLESGKGVSNLIQQLRDEAHRFAKKYHTKLRSKKTIKGLS